MPCLEDDAGNQFDHKAIDDSHHPSPAQVFPPAKFGISRRRLLCIGDAKKVIDKIPAFRFKDRTYWGGLVLIGKAAVLKTAGFCPWGFESLILRHNIV